MDGDNDKKKMEQKEIAIQQFQHEFNGRYPFLKIEVLKNILAKPALKIVLQNGIQPSLNNDILFYANMISLGMQRTVAEVEKDFCNLYNLPVQIFRKSGNVWVETSLTDDWTLEHQNSEGEQISALF